MLIIERPNKARHSGLKMDYWRVKNDCLITFKNKEAVRLLRLLVKQAENNK